MTLRERLVASVTDIRDRGRRLVELNLELLVAELKEKGRKFGAAIGLFAAAGLLALYGIGFVLATIVVLLALVLPLWASMLIVTVVVFVVIAILVLVGRAQLRKIGKPEPEAAIAEAKETADLVKRSARQTANGVRDRVWPSRKPEPEVLPPRPAGWQPPAPGTPPPTRPPGTPPPTTPPPTTPTGTPPAPSTTPPAPSTTPPSSGPAADPGRGQS